MEGCPGHLVHLVNSALNSATKRCPSSAAISSSSNSNSPSSVYITPPVAAVSLVTSRRRRLVRHQPSPLSFHRSRSRDCRNCWSRPRSRPRWTLAPPAASLIVSTSTISATFSSKTAIAKFRNARQTRMADVDSNIQHRHVTLKNHCS